MQSSQKIMHALRALIKLVEEEAAENPSSAEQLEAIAAGLSTPRAAKTGA